MKRVIIAVISVCFVIVVIVSFYIINCGGTHPSALNEVLKVLLSSTLTGFVTFLGFLFTLLSQEKRFNIENENTICPSFIINSTRPPSVETENSIPESRLPMITCTDNQKKRAVECTCINCRENYALNVYVNHDGKMQYISFKDNACEISLILSSETESYFEIFFENIYGQKYKQKITYCYQNEYKNVAFVSSIPERINHE